MQSIETDALHQDIKLFPLNRRTRVILIRAMLLTLDLLALLFAFWLAFETRFVLLEYFAVFDLATYIRLLVFAIPLFILLFLFWGLYDLSNLFGGLHEYAAVFNAVTTGFVAVIILGFLLRDRLEISRGWLAISFFLVLFLVSFARFFFRRLIYALRSKGHFLSPALIIGVNDCGIMISEQLQNWSTSGLYITGFLDDHFPAGQGIANGYKCLGGLVDLDSVLAQGQIEEVIVVPTALTRDQLLNLYRRLNHRPNITLRLSTGLFEILNTGLRVKELAYVPLIELQPTRISGFNAFLKFVLDYALALVAILILSPFMLLIALIVRLDSPGPLIYRRRVMGVGGAQFDAFKFRTMRIDGDQLLAASPGLKQELERNHKLHDDPRITRFGHFLRKYSLDELPQLFNVLFGQMSLVGPRMISPPEMQKYGKWDLNLLTVKPGITGFWQINGRSDVSYEERVQLDMYYIRNWTIWLDLYILFKTPIAVLRKKGAY